MDMTMSSATPSRVEVVTSVQRRRRWTPEQKLEIVKQTIEPGSSVSMVARQFGITAAQLLQWRKAYLQGSLVSVGTNETVIPASELQEVMRESEWMGLRKSPPRGDDAAIKQATANVVKNRATHGYRRVWARLRLQGHDRVNHKRVYRVMRDEGWLLYRHGEKPVDTRKHEAKVAVKDSDVRWCSDSLGLLCDNGEKVQVAFALDCCGREIMSWVATTKGIDAALVGHLMMQAMENRSGPFGKPPKPIEWLTDNGSCYTADQAI